MKANHDKGFTLIEVVVALTVVAIVSTSLFQMFVTTSYVNRDAQLSDLANVIAVGQAETFKADPEHYDSTTKYYNSNGTIDIPSKAVIQVDSVVTPTDLDVNDTGYFPSFVGPIDLSNNLDWDVQITTTSGIYYGPHVDPPVVPPGAGLTLLTPATGFIMQNQVLPINVFFTSGIQPSRTIHLINNSAVEVDIYFFTPVNNPSDPVEQTVNHIPVSGYSSLTVVKQTTPHNTKYHLELTVSKLIGNVPQFMFNYSTDKYLYH